jgi:hypothetical protein
MMPIAAPWLREIMMIPSSDNPMPKIAAAIVTESGPKNTRAKVAIASASQARGFTNTCH